MANAIKSNLEMVDVLQDKMNKEHVQNNQISLQGQSGGQLHRQLQLPLQGCTIKSDLQITGPKKFSDTAWKTKKIPGIAMETATGLGVFCQLQDNFQNAMVMIQASVPTADSVLQAEAEALLLAARVAAVLCLQHHTFLTDSSVLAAAAASASTNLQQVPWEIRRHIATYSQLSGSSIFHIKRDLNGVAHNCAHQALRQSLSQPIFSCSCSAHRNQTCPILSAVQQVHITGLVIHGVNCL